MPENKGGKLMSEYILSCCSTADLSKEYFESRNIHYICFHSVSYTHLTLPTNSKV